MPTPLSLHRLPYCGVVLFGEVVVFGLVVLLGVVEFRDRRLRFVPLFVCPVVVSVVDPGVVVVGMLGSVVVDPGFVPGVAVSGVMGTV